VEHTKQPFSHGEKTSIFLLVALAVVCIIFVVSPLSSGDVLLYILSFPYAQIGLGLRVLSLLGRVGNVFALLLYFGLLGVPMYIWSFKKDRKFEDSLIFIFAMLMMWAMFYLINPGRLSWIIGDTRFQNAVIGGTLHSFMLAYVVLKFMRYLGTTDVSKLGRWMGFGLYFLSGIFVIAVFGVGLQQMLTDFEALRVGNMGNEHLLGITYVFITLRHIVGVLPYGLNIGVCFAALRLLKAFRGDPYSEETTFAAESVARVCKVVLGVTMFSSAGFHVIQFFLIGQLKDIHGNLVLPVTAVLFVLGALLLTRYIAANKQLKDENEGFI